MKCNKIFTYGISLLSMCGPTYFILKLLADYGSVVQS